MSSEKRNTSSKNYHLISKSLNIFSRFGEDGLKEDDEMRFEIDQKNIDQPEEEIIQNFMKQSRVE